jgi:hypothetical protein
VIVLRYVDVNHVFFFSMTGLLQKKACRQQISIFLIAGPLGKKNPQHSFADRGGGVF